MTQDAFFRILLVDDSKAMRELLKRLIDMNDITPYVKEAANGHEALLIFSKFKPDLVVLDLQMPEMDGLETLRHMKKINPSVKVMVLSLTGSRNDTQDAINLGACDYIMKPFDRNEFAFKVIKNLREKANEDQINALLKTTKALEDKLVNNKTLTNLKQ